jgi:single-strand DNA-binding protein
MSYIVIEGNVTADATLREFDGRDGQKRPISNATVVVNDRRYDRQSDKWVETGRTAYEVTVAGTEAIHFAASAGKGTRVIIAGTLSTEEYHDRDGNQRTRRRIQVDHHGLSSKFTALAPTSSTSHAVEPAPAEEREPEPVG